MPLLGDFDIPAWALIAGLSPPPDHLENLLSSSCLNAVWLTPPHENMFGAWAM
jgi:hypothetical protein